MADVVMDPVGTLTLQAVETAGDFGKDAFVLLWRFNEITATQMESPVVARATKLGTEKWTMKLAETSDATFKLTVIGDGCESGVLECRKTVKFTRGAAEETQRSSEGSSDQQFVFDLEDGEECFNFEVTISILLGGCAGAKTLDDFKSLYRQAVLTDFLIVSPNAQRMRVHRCVMASGSQFFKAMLTNNSRESQAGLVEIGETDAKSLQIFVEWMYGITDHFAGLSCSQLRNVYMLAERYQVDALMRCAIIKMREQDLLQIEDSAEHYLFALRYGLPSVASDAVTRVRQNYLKFVEDGGLDVIMAAGRESMRSFFLDFAESDVKREEGIIRWTIPDVRRLKEGIEQRSPYVQVRGVPWCIRVGKQKSEPPMGRSWSFGVFLECDLSKERHDWACFAPSSMKILPYRKGDAVIERKVTMTSPFTATAPNWGCSSFLPMEKLTDTSQGFVNPTDHSLRLEIRFTTLAV